MKRLHRFLSKKKEKKLIDRLIYIAAVIYPLAGLPQIVQIFVSKSAEDLSLLSYLLFFILELVFLAYGLLYKLRPIILSAVLWDVYYITALVGILIYS